MGALPHLPKEVADSGASNEHTKPTEEAYQRTLHDLEQFKQRISALELEQECLRAQISSGAHADLCVDTLRVLLHMFLTQTAGHRDVGVMARKIRMERRILQTHLDRLRDDGLAESGHGSHRLGHMYWTLTPRGQRYVVDRKLAVSATKAGE